MVECISSEICGTSYTDPSVEVIAERDLCVKEQRSANRSPFKDLSMPGWNSKPLQDMLKTLGLPLA